MTKLTTKKRLGVFGSVVGAVLLLFTTSCDIEAVLTSIFGGCDCNCECDDLLGGSDPEQICADPVPAGETCAEACAMQSIGISGCFQN